jgi:ubiquinone/menaquinone biosynthesis C-methylase UbiE
MSDKNYVKIDEVNFKKFINNNNNKKEILEKLFKKYGSNFRLNLSDLDSNSKNLLGDTLVNELYKKAYNFDFIRYTQYYFQLIEILNLPKTSINKILEVGPGLGILKNLLNNYDYKYVSLDLDKKNNPDILGSVTDIPMENNSVDLVCAFQILEHLPFNDFLEALNEINRVSSTYLYISLPCNTSSIRLNLDININQRYLSRLAMLNLNYFKPFLIKLKEDKKEKELLERPDSINPHYWEVGTKSYSKKRIREILKNNKIKILKDYHNPYKSYHWYILGELIK